MKFELKPEIKKILFWMGVNNWRNSLSNFGIKNYQKTEPGTNAFIPLSPTDAPEEVKPYTDALFWALQNRKEKDIKNIALTGPNGSGKSSILKSFQKQYFYGYGFQFLNISLATFSEETKADFETREEGTTQDIQATGAHENNALKGSDLQRLLEISILQQIFYHEKDSILPDSRLEKIRSQSLWSIIFKTISLSCLLASAINLMYPNLLCQLTRDKMPSSLEDALYWTTLSITTIGFLVIVHLFVKYINRLQISKLAFQNTFELKADKKSILNHHYDEILYFFEATKYNVVIIEDLDRFEETEIFTKLREINLLLNSSKKIDPIRNIVFVYAVKDDIFINKDRTKFFDFIIPVIPIIDSSNSASRFQKLIVPFGFDWDSKFIENLCLFIDDMRLLLNSVNEFQIYKKIHSSGLNEERLFAVLVYKNLFPQDFSNVLNGKSQLNLVFSKKNELIKRKEDKLKEDKEILINDINRLENLKIKDLHELRWLYLGRLLSKIPLSHPLKVFIADGVELQISEIIDEENFEKLENGSLQYIPEYGSRRNLPITFSALQREVDPNQTYFQRLEDINNETEGKVSADKKKLQKLDLERAKLRELRIQDLLAADELELEANPSPLERFIGIMLRNGYINEDYLHYTSIFYEGLLTKADQQFLLYTLNKEKTDFGYSLNKLENLVPRININDFGKEYCLNYHLVDFLLINELEYSNQLNLVMEGLSSHSPRSIQFIDGMIGQSPVVSKFISILCLKWHSIWDFIEKDTTQFSDEKLDIYFKLILEHAAVEDIKSISEESTLKDRILQNPQFPAIFSSSEKLKAIIETLKLKFRNLENELVSDEIMEFIHLNDAYELNFEMIHLIISRLSKNEHLDFKAKNFSTIRTSGCKALNDYILREVNFYVQNVMLKLEDKILDDEEFLVELLNNPNLEIELKRKIIEKMSNSISEISVVEDEEIRKMLFLGLKVFPSWVNLYMQMNDENETVPEEIVDFVNDLENANHLSSMGLEDLEIEFGEESVKSFVKLFLLKDSISIESYELLLGASPYVYDEFEVDNISEQKVNLLIETLSLSLTQEIYNKLVLRKGVNSIKYLELWAVDQLDEVLELELTSDVNAQLLRSKEINIEAKQRIVNALDTDQILNHDALMWGIAGLIAENPSFVVNNHAVSAILTIPNLNVETRILVFCSRPQIFSHEAIGEFLVALSKPFEEILDKSKRAKIPKSETNKLLLSSLELIHFISSFSETEHHYRVNHFK